MFGSLLFAGATHIREQAKIDAARITQKSGNELRASATALQQFSAALGNKRRMEAAGSQVNDLAGNSARIQRSLTHSTLQGRIRAAEELGSVVAMTGAAGVGGASVETYNETLRLQTAIKEAAAERAVGQQEWATAQQRGNAIKAAVAGMDNNVYRANLDYTQYVDHKKPGFLERTLGIGLTAAATVFGGPQAGAAVMGVFESIDAARNGDFANADKALSGSFYNAVGAVRTNHVLGGDKPPSAGSADAQAGKALSDLEGGTWGPGAGSFFNLGQYASRHLGSITIK